MILEVIRAWSRARTSARLHASLKIGINITGAGDHRMNQRPALWMLLPGLLLTFASLSLSIPSDDILEMTVKGVALDPYGNTPIVVLEEIQEHRAFPIWIGLHEAQAIIHALEGTSTPRPMTHTLLHKILNNLQVKISRIIINDLQNNTFYASISLQQGTTTVTLDARPSDAIALALAVHAPIFATRSVLKAVRTVKLSTPLISEQTAKKFGMHLQSLNARLAKALHFSNRKGALVTFVEPNSMAERQAIKRGDLITGANGKTITSLLELVKFFNTRQIDRNIALQVWRDNKTHAIDIPPGSVD